MEKYYCGYFRHSHGVISGVRELQLLCLMQNVVRHGRTRGREGGREGLDTSCGGRRGESRKRRSRRWRKGERGEGRSLKCVLFRICPRAAHDAVTMFY